MTDNNRDIHEFMGRVAADTTWIRNSVKDLHDKLDGQIQFSAKERSRIEQKLADLREVVVQHRTQLGMIAAGIAFFTALVVALSKWVLTKAW